MRIRISPITHARKPEYRIAVETNVRTGEIKSAYFQFAKGVSMDVNGLSGGRAFAYYGRKGKLLGLEITSPCDIGLLMELGAAHEITEFILGAAPRKLLIG